MRVSIAACLLAAFSSLVAQEQPKPLATGEPVTKAELTQRIAEATDALLQADLKARAARLELFRLGGIPNSQVKRLVPNGFTAHLVPHPSAKGKQVQKTEAKFSLDGYGHINGVGTVTQEVKGVGVRLTIKMPPTQEAYRELDLVACDLILSGDQGARLVVGDKVTFDGVYEIGELVAVDGFKEKLPVVRLVERYKLPR